MAKGRCVFPSRKSNMNSKCNILQHAGLRSCVTVVHVVRPRNKTTQVLQIRIANKKRFSFWGTRCAQFCKCYICVAKVQGCFSLWGARCAHCVTVALADRKSKEACDFGMLDLRSSGAVEFRWSKIKGCLRLWCSRRSNLCNRCSVRSKIKGCLWLWCAIRPKRCSC